MKGAIMIEMLAGPSIADGAMISAAAAVGSLALALAAGLAVRVAYWSARDTIARRRRRRQEPTE